MLHESAFWQKADSCAYLSKEAIMKPHYLNTDLELNSAEDLSPIIDAFGNAVFVPHHDMVDELHFASFEVA